MSDVFNRFHLFISVSFGLFGSNDPCENELCKKVKLVKIILTQVGVNFEVKGSAGSALMCNLIGG